jgi:predicted nuclease of predicted toxin-antitoxin system
LTNKFKVDENLPVDVATLLRSAGHDAATVVEEQLGGRPDDAIMRACRLEQRALITLDLGFGDIRAYPPDEQPGIVVLRLSTLDRIHVVAAVKNLLPLLDTEQLSRRLWIVDESSVRIRA